MSALRIAALAAAALIILSAAARLVGAPIKFVFKLLLSSALGFAALLALELLGSPLGIELGVNIPNALVVGVLGIPGFALLLVLNWYAHT